MASVCFRLDGIPLAIELAAARVRSLSVEDLNGKLDQRFRILIRGSRTALPRQQTLRALVDWSYDLLSSPEKALLRRLSVFAGGWTLDAAEAVCAGDEVKEWEVLDLLTSLSDKSLAVAEPSGSMMRYRLLETVRQYAHDACWKRTGPRRSATGTSSSLPLLRMSLRLTLGRPRSRSRPIERKRRSTTFARHWNGAAKRLLGANSEFD